MSVRRKNNTNYLNESNLTFSLKLHYIIRKKLLLSCPKSVKSPIPRLYNYPLADAGLDQAQMRPPACRQLSLPTPAPQPQ